MNDGIFLIQGRNLTVLTAAPTRPKIFYKRPSLTFLRFWPVERRAGATVGSC